MRPAAEHRLPLTPFLRELRELRALLEAEVPRHLHPGARGTSREAEYAHAVGRPFTPEFRRYLGHADGWGYTRLGMLSIIEVGAWCYQRHQTHRCAGKPLCEALLMRIAYWQHDCPPALHQMALRALRHAAGWRARQLRPRLTEPLPYQKLPSGADRARMPPDGQRRVRRKGRSASRPGRAAPPRLRTEGTTRS